MNSRPNATPAPMVPGTTISLAQKCQSAATTKHRLTITWCICFLEDLTSRHVSHTIAQEGCGRDDGLFGASGDVGWDQSPGQEKRKHVGHGDQVHAPFRPHVGRAIWDHRQSDQSDKRGDGRCSHDVQTTVRHTAGIYADNQEETE
jgi:hypothetical protein